MRINQYTEKIRNNHIYQEDTSDCGPYAIAMTVNALMDLSMDAIDISQAMNKPRWWLIFPIILRLPSWATFPWGITWYLRQLGLVSKWQLFSSRRSLIENINTNQLQIVLVGGFFPLWAHYKILVAYDEATDEFGFIDPGARLPNIIWESSQTYYHDWRNFCQIRIIAKNTKSHIDFTLVY